MRRQYEVPQNEPQREDDSFKLCFGTMLVFLALMALTLVCFWPRNMVQRKVSYSDTVHDSWSGHLGIKYKTTTSSTVKPTTSSETKSTSYTSSSWRRTVPTLNKFSTEKTSSAQFLPTTEVPDTSDDVNDVSLTLLGRREFSLSAPTSVPLVTDSDETTSFVAKTSDGEEILNISEPNLKSTSEVSISSSTSLGNIKFDAIPDSSENTIPYSSSSRVMNEFASTIEDLTSNTYEDSSTLASMNAVSTKQAQMTVTLDVSVSDSSRTKVNPVLESSVPTTTTNTEDDTTVEQDLLDVRLMMTDKTEESSSDPLRSDLISIDNPTTQASSPSTNIVPSTLDYSSFSWLDESNSEKSSTKSRYLNDTVEDFLFDVSTTESSCMKCPEPVCPVCLVQACSDIEAAPPLPDSTCRTSECHVFASRLLSLVDVSVDPCEDFYSYACGGLLNNPVLMEDNPSLHVWTRIEKAVKNISPASPSSHQKLKNYYDGCVDYDKLITLEERKAQGRDVIETVGKFFDASTTPEEDLTELLIRLFKHGSGILFSIGLDVDSGNSSQLQVMLSLPARVSSRLRGESSRCEHSADDDIPLNLTQAYEAYTDCVNNISETLDRIQEALEFFHPFNNDSSQLIQDILISAELDLLPLLKDLPPADLARKAIQSKTYKLLSKLQLESEIPQIAWGHLLSTLFNVEFDDDTKVQVYFMDYIKDLFAQLQTKSSRSVHNCLLAVFALDLYSDVAQTHSALDRERHCLRVTANLLPVVTSNLYLATFPPDVDLALRQQVMLIYQQLVSVMETRISAAAWLDERSLNELMKKLRSLSIQLPEMFSDVQLVSSLGKCDLSKKQYLEDSVCLLQQLQSLTFELYSLDPRTSEVIWSHFLTSFSTTPLFIHGLNTFLIPHTALVPVYDKEMPKHVVLAHLGNIVARGIAHSFDSTGVKFTANGNAGLVLSEAASLTYESVVNNSNLQFMETKSLRQAAHTYTYLLEPELTLDERLSDITAANLSLSLLSEDSHLPWLPFSHKQVYFLSLAQSFCSRKKVPEVFTSLYEGTSLLPFDRVSHLAANSEQFAEEFRCAQGTNTNLHSEWKTRPFPLFDQEQLHAEPTS